MSKSKTPWFGLLLILLLGSYCWHRISNNKREYAKDVARDHALLEAERLRVREFSQKYGARTDWKSEDLEKADQLLSADLLRVTRKDARPILVLAKLDDIGLKDGVPHALLSGTLALTELEYDLTCPSVKLETLERPSYLDNVYAVIASISDVRKEKGKKQDDPDYLVLTGTCADLIRLGRFGQELMYGDGDITLKALHSPDDTEP